MCCLSGKVASSFSSLFKPCAMDLKGLKKDILATLYDYKVPAVVKSLRDERLSILPVKILLNDHKPDIPLMVVITGRGSFKK